MRSVTPRTHRSIRKAILIGLALLAVPSTCQAFHGATVHAWRRTWYGQDALYTPLRPYFIPRLPGRCDRDPSIGCLSAAGCNDCPNGAHVAPYGAGTTVLMPLQSERLGQIPNDMGVNGALPVATPGR